MPQAPFTVRALFEYKSDYDDDLSFPAGQTITVTAVEDDEWYSGSYDGKSGMFPRNFVEEVAAAAEAAGPEEEASQAAEPIEPQNADLPKPEPPIADPEPAPSPVAERKPALSGPGVFPTQKISDPYGVKKQFIASSKSSYVPQVKPRDESFLIGKARHQQASRDVEIVNEHTQQPEADDEPEEAKLSLKERIALLQKRQQEQSERDAAALKRQEVRKQKAVEERKKMKEKREADAARDHEEEGGDAEGLTTIATGNSSIRATSTGNASIREEVAEDDAEDAREDDGVEEDNEDEDNGEEEEGDEDDEDLRRRKLVERMAKMSGGRNMFGMMGVPAFGQAAPASKPKKTKKTEHKVATQEEEEETCKPIPIMPFADPNDPPPAIEKYLHQTKSEAEEDDEFVDAGETKAAIKNIDKEFFSDEEEDTTEPEKLASPIRAAPPVPPVPNTPTSPVATKRPAVAAPPVPTHRRQSEAETPESDDTMRISKPLDSEATGYEADEDFSEGKLPSSNPLDASPVAPTTRPPPNARPPPPMPPSVPPAPLRAAAPPVPTIPPVPSHSRPPPPPVPSVPADIPNDESSEEETEQLGSLPAHSSAPVPPIPTAVPPAPVPVTKETSDEEDDDFEFTSGTGFVPEAPSRSKTLPPRAMPPPPVPTDSIPPPVHTESFRRASTDLSNQQARSPLSRNHTGASLNSSRKSGEFARSKQLSQADAALEALEYEIANISSNSSWWLKSSLPEFLEAKIGTDLIYEIDTNHIEKRDSRVKTYKDYYILFHDLSQLVLELEYENQDPRSTIKATNFFTKAAPIIRKDLLDKFHKKNGNKVLGAALAVTEASESLVNVVFGKLNKEVLQPIGSKSFGVNIYKNTNNSNIARIDEIKPGDILCIKNGKFVSHKALGPAKSISVGEDEIKAVIIAEYDPKKEKFRVLDIEAGHLKKDSYKLTDMKSGQIRVFRVVDRSYVGW